MTAIRRIYVYLLAFAGLWMLAGGAANLGRVVLELLASAAATANTGYVREEVSRWGAAALVGLPVWLLHWWWAQRAAQGDPSEVVSALRRLYLYAVLAVAVLAGASALHEAMQAALETRPPSASLPPLATATVALLVWVYHWPVARQVAEHGGTLRRWYVYGSAFVGYLLLLNGARLIIERSWELAVGSSASSGAPMGLLAGGIADALVGLGVWLLHWVVLRPVHPGEERATLRSVYLFLTLAVAVAGTLGGLSEALYYALGRALGIERPGGVGGSLLQAAAGPVSIVVVHGCAWLYTRAALRQHALETPRQAGVRRLYTYLVALISLLMLVVGVAGLLWVVADALTSAPGTAGADWWRDRVAAFVTLTVVGLPVWLLHWRPTAATTSDELTAFSRRLYVYLTLIAASLTLLGSAALAAYRLLTLVLGARPEPSLSSELAHDLANALVAGVVIGYHWQALRGPAAAVAGEPSREEAVAAEPSRYEAVATEPAGYEAVLRVRAPDAQALEAALQRLREAGLDVDAV